MEVYINAKIYTMDEENPTATGLVIDGNKILYVGDDEGALAYLKDDMYAYDLRGKETILPGFIDTHVHLLNYAYGLTKIDLSDVRSIDEIIDKAQFYIEKCRIPEGEWVLGRGWNNNLLRENRMLNRYDLDKISTVHPILMTRICEHSVVVNSKALEILNITKDTENPEGGEIEKDEKGEPTGLLRENARYIAYNAQRDRTKDEIKEMLLYAVDEASSYGLTTLHTDDFETFSGKNYENIIKAYEELKEEGKLKVRIYEQCLLPEKKRLEEFLEKGYKTGCGDDFFKIGPLKLLTDGSLGQRTAYLLDDYSDDKGNRGLPIFTQEELDELVDIAHSNNMQVLCHGIGDGAIDMILKSYEKALHKKPDDNHRMGIVHYQITTPEQLKKTKDMDVLVYAEPICIGQDMHCAESRVGDRLKTSYQYRTIKEMGIKMPISSDCPVDSLNPIHSIHIAVNSKDLNNEPKDGWYKEQALTVKQMIEGFTTLGAYASFDEDKKGKIKAGYLADFVILSEDIFKTKKENIQDVFVLSTYMDGKQTYFGEREYVRF